MFTKITRLYGSALVKWGWVVVAVSMVLAAVAIQRLHDRYQAWNDPTESVTYTLKITVMYKRLNKFSRESIPVLVADVQSAVRAMSDEIEGLKYKDFSLSPKTGIDMAIIQLRSDDKAELEKHKEKIIGNLLQYIRATAKEEAAELEVQLGWINQMVKYLREFGDDGEYDGRFRWLSNRGIASIVELFAVQERTRRQLQSVKVWAERPERVFNIEVNEHREGVEKPKQPFALVAAKLLIYTLIGSLLLVFVFEIGLRRARELVADDR